MKSFSYEEIVIARNVNEAKLTVDVVVIQIDPKLASSILEQFCNDIPLENFDLNHLKRMRVDRDIPIEENMTKKLSIIVCPVRNYDAIPEHIKQLCSSHSQSVVKVCQIEPESKEEFVRFSVWWPVNFHAKQLEKDREKGFSKIELEHMHKVVECLIEDENRVSSLYAQRNLKSSSSCPCGAVIVNPVNNCIVMTSFKAIHSLNQTIASSSSGSSSGSGDSSSIDAILTHPLYTPTMLCIEGVAAIVRGELDGEGSLPDNYYLCTGLDLYVTEEPEVMACMALVHSRIRRVFFRRPSEECGALQSGEEHIHCLPSLNHHYRAFRIKEDHDNEDK